MRSFTVLSLAFFAVAASGQVASTAGSATNSTGGVPGGIVRVPSGAVISSSPWFFSTAGPGMPGGVVTGAPYSAEQVTERFQTLADGTHITQPAQTTKLYRDSAGRTRTERSFPLPPGPLGNVTDVPSFIEISDPVAGVRYTLESRSHTAQRIPATPPPPPAQANGAPAAKMIRLLPAQISPPAASALQDQTPGPQISRESLGAQTIEGVLAEGSRTTVTYPVGAVGNDRPFTTTTETWTSPELRIVVLSKDSDPRNGDSTTRLTSISRAEPDASLFTVPPDYEIIEPDTAIRH